MKMTFPIGRHTDELLEKAKRFEPALWLREVPHSRIPQRFGKGVQLVAQSAVGKASVLKGKLVLEAFSHEERLSDAPPAVYSNELRILVVNG
jgi:hypothetical protein